ncbi:MAG: HlyD family efflux transporter periplasmic adaptor subunit [Phycisphaerales bacterium]|nr:HlyD family efflux transporter periplasmic adaptor subunit [Phycisphaerales bacterium]
MSADFTTPNESTVAPEVLPKAARRFSWRLALIAMGFVGLLVFTTNYLLDGRSWSDSSTRRGATPGLQSGHDLDLHTVARTDFDIAIPVSGELAALRQVEVRNLLEGRAVITEIVAEGRRVATGDVLLKFASEEAADKIKDLQDKLKTAQAEAVSNEQALAIKKNERASEIEKANLQVQLAQLALEGWISGDLVSKRQTLATEIEAATIDAERLRKRYAESEALVTKGFISRDEYERDRIALIQADAKVKQSALNIEVYEKFQRPQDEAKKRSDLEQATAERARTEQKKDSEIVKAQSDFESSVFRTKNASERLVQGERALENTTIRSPTDGLVVYASSLESGGWGRTGDSAPLAAGTELKPNELAMIIPDTSQMVAYLKVSEALSGQIKPDQGVTIFSDASPTTPIHGTVMNVSVLAESGGWRDPNRRDYKVRVLLDETESLALKPSMRCKASILLGSANDVLSVPVQSVFRMGAVTFVYIPDGMGFSQQKVVIGRSNEMETEVLSGLEAGDQVLLREPGADEVVARLPAEVTNPKDQSSTKASGLTTGHTTSGRPVRDN